MRQEKMMEEEFQASEESMINGNSSKGHKPEEDTDCFPNIGDNSLKAPSNIYPLVNSFNISNHSCGAGTNLSGKGIFSAP